MGSSFGGGGGGSDGGDGSGGGDGDASQPVAVLCYRVLPQYTMHPARTLLMRATGRKKNSQANSVTYLCTYGTVLQVASLRPTLGAYLPTLPALRPRLRIGLRLTPRLLAFVLTRRLRVGRRLRRAADPHRGASALRRRLRIGRRLRGRATVARRRVAMLLADVRSHR